MDKGIKYFLNHPNKKAWARIVWEILVLTIQKKEIPLHYFTKYLYKKGVTNISDYLTKKQITKITMSGRFDKPEYALFLQHKLALSFLLEKNAVPQPKRYFHNFGNRFYLNENCHLLNKPRDLANFLVKVFDLYQVTSCFLKPISDYGGKGCYLLTAENLEQQLESLSKAVLSGDYIAQEVIVQHAHINSINSNCINSIRIDTYIDLKGNTHIFSAFIRFGMGNSVVDNASSGGFYVGIDLKTGRLKPVGQQLFSYGSKQFTKHPDTDFEFADFQIPFFKEALELVLHAVNVVPNRLVGWDVAITPSGPIIIEGNIKASIYASDVAYGGLLQQAIFKEIMSQI